MKKKNRTDLFGAALLGAGLVYLLDPDRGARRRGLVRDQAIRAGHKVAGGLGAAARDFGNRAKGTVAELRSRVKADTADDVVLEERARSAIGRVTSHPRAIEVVAEDGHVTLRGPVLEREHDRVIATARRVRGVDSVIDRLEVFKESGDIPSLQGGRPREARPELLQTRWAPATRVLMGTLGGLLVYRARRGERLVDLVTAAAGAALVARATTNLPGKQLIGVGAGQGAIDLQKVINVRAPIERVWQIWSDYEHFPRFMTHLKEVRRTSADRSHWIAKGPAGTSFEWDAVTTSWVPNELIAWKSVEGSPLENVGRVQLRPISDQATQIDVRLTYNPPGGAAGHAFATIFGVDPKRAMDEDLLRLKSLLEEGKTTADQGSVRQDEILAGSSGRGNTER
jgi:uncharacterized membrane protein